MSAIRLRAIIRNISVLLLLILFVTMVIQRHGEHLKQEKSSEPTADVADDNSLLQQEVQKKEIQKNTRDIPQNVVNEQPQNWAQEVEVLTSPTLDFAETKSRLLSFRTSIKESCSQVLSQEELSRPINTWEFVINHEYKLVYCPIFKAASSTWIYNFLLMANADIGRMERSETSPVEFARKNFYPRPKLKQTKTVLNDSVYTSFMIVREPFQRLLSAYRDKLESTSQFYYEALRCRMSQGRRESESFRCQPTFTQFVSYLLEQDSKGRTPDEHWAPFFRFCSPCQANFDFVFTFEKLAEYETFLVHEIPQLASVLQPRKLHSSHTDYQKIADEYFSQLTPDLIKGLIRIYGKDFDIFGYDVGKYMRFT